MGATVNGELMMQFLSEIQTSDARKIPLPRNYSLFRSLRVQLHAEINMINSFINTLKRKCTAGKVQCLERYLVSIESPHHIHLISVCAMKSGSI